MSAWAKRKAAVAAEEAELIRAEEAAQKAKAEAEIAEKSDEELLADFELPVPEEMGEGDDFRAFMGEAVPARLKTRALRQLWKVNPVLANVDGLVDYGEDFTDAAMCVENLQSAYQVGKGMLAHVQELARQEHEAAAPMSDLPHEEDEVEVAEEAPLESMPEPVFQAESESQPENEQEPDAPPVPGSRRMTFTFDEQRTG